MGNKEKNVEVRFLNPDEVVEGPAPYQVDVSDEAAQGFFAKKEAQHKLPYDSSELQEEYGIEVKPPAEEFFRFGSETEDFGSGVGSDEEVSGLGAGPVFYPETWRRLKNYLLEEQQAAVMSFVPEEHQTEILNNPEMTKNMSEEQKARLSRQRSKVPGEDIMMKALGTHAAGMGHIYKTMGVLTADLAPVFGMKAKDYVDAIVGNWFELAETANKYSKDASVFGRVAGTAAGSLPGIADFMMQVRTGGALSGARGFQEGRILEEKDIVGALKSGGADFLEFVVIKSLFGMLHGAPLSAQGPAMGGIFAGQAAVHGERDPEALLESFGTGIAFAAAGVPKTISENAKMRVLDRVMNNPAAEMTYPDFKILKKVLGVKSDADTMPFTDKIKYWMEKPFGAETGAINLEAFPAAWKELKSGTKALKTKLTKAGVKDAGAYIRKEGYGGVKGEDLPPDFIDRARRRISLERRVPKIQPKELARRALEYPGMRYWYEEGAMYFTELMRRMPVEELNRFIDVFAAASTQSTPSSNWSKAMNAYTAYLEGVPFEAAARKVGLGEDVALRAFMGFSRAIETKFNEVTGTRGETAAGKTAGKLKLEDYSDTLKLLTSKQLNDAVMGARRDIEVEFDSPVTDMWMIRMFMPLKVRYDKTLGKDTVGSLSSVEYEYVKDQMNAGLAELRKQPGYEDATIWQMQAMLWEWAKKNTVKDPHSSQEKAEMMSDWVNKRAGEYLGKEPGKVTPEEGLGFIRSWVSFGPESKEASTALTIFDHYMTPESFARAATAGDVKDGFVVLDTKQMGKKGKAGRESRRFGDMLKKGISAMHLYSAKGNEAVQPELTLFNKESSIPVSLIARSEVFLDLTKPENLDHWRELVKEKNGDLTEVEAAILDEGYIGYTVDQGSFRVSKFFSNKDVDTKLVGTILNRYMPAISPVTSAEKVKQARNNGDKEGADRLQRVLDAEKDGDYTVGTREMSDLLESVIGEYPGVRIVDEGPGEGHSIWGIETSPKIILEGSDTMVKGLTARLAKDFYQDAAIVSRHVRDQEIPDVGAEQAKSTVLSFKGELDTQQRSMVSAVLQESGLPGATFHFTDNALVIHHLPGAGKAKGGKLNKKQQKDVETYLESAERFVRSLGNQVDKGADIPDFDVKTSWFKNELIVNDWSTKSKGEAYDRLIGAAEKERSRLLPGVGEKGAYSIEGQAGRGFRFPGEGPGYGGVPYKGTATQRPLIFGSETGAVDLGVFGNSAKALFTIKKEAPEKAKELLNMEWASEPDYRKNKTGDVPIAKINYNLARISTMKDVEQMQVEIGEQFKADFEAAAPRTTHAKIKKEMEQKLADDMGIDVKTMLESVGGFQFPWEVQALRTMALSAQEQAMELAKLARGSTASTENMAAYQKAFTLAVALTEKMSSRKRIHAQSLNAMKATVTSNQKMMDEQFQKLILNGGGPRMVKESAELLAAMAEGQFKPTIEQVSKTMEKMKRATGVDMLYEIWVNGLLSGLKTQSVNILSNTGVAIMTNFENYLSATVSKTPGIGSGEFSYAEANAGLYGMLNGLKDGLRAGFHVVKTGEAWDESNKMDIAGGHPKAVTAANIKANLEGEGEYMGAPARALGIKELKFLDEGRMLATAIDLVGDLLIRLPGRGLNAGDAVFKTIGYRMGLHQRIAREIYNNPEGLTPLEAAQWKKDVLSDPEKFAPDLHLGAVSQADYQTFTNALKGFSRHIQAAREDDSWPGFTAKVVVPFVRTPVNIFRYGAIERSPLGLMGLLSKKTQLREQIAKGGATRDMAIGRLVLGGLVTGLVAKMVTEGVITGAGPVDDDMRRLQRAQGIEPYSINVGGKSFRYDRLDPIGHMVGMTADAVEIMAEMDYMDSGDVAAAIILAISNNMTNKTYMRGVSDLLGAVDPYDGRWKMPKYLKRQAASLMPYSSLMGHTAKAIDKRMTEARSLVDHFRARTPWGSKDVPPRRNHRGEIIVPLPGVGHELFGPIADLTMPLYYAKHTNNAMDRELMSLMKNGDLRFQFTPGNRINGIKLRNWIADDGTKHWEQDDYNRISGELLVKNVEALIKTSEYRNANVLNKSKMAKRTIDMARDEARQKVIEKHGRIQMMISMRQEFEQKVSEAPQGGLGEVMRRVTQGTRTINIGGQ